MIITKISDGKGKKRHIYIDDEYSFSLIDSDVVYFKLKEGEEIDKDKYEFITQTLLYMKAQKKALKYLSHRQKSAFETEKKLSEENFSADIKERVMAFLKEYGYVDDFKYAVSYIKDCLNFNPKGKRLMAWELKNKGIEKECISKALDEALIDEFYYAGKLLEKKFGRYEKESLNYGKMEAFLTRRGYEYDVIKETITKFME
ncbi:MAG: RecX family transcriptional regulator [Lachnospiraceae bacterium]|nr:RecX family transcriptional regulator [Lachnospiraceae bacterium]